MYDQMIQEILQEVRSAMARESVSLEKAKTPKELNDTQKQLMFMYECLESAQNLMKIQASKS